MGFFPLSCYGALQTAIGMDAVECAAIPSASHSSCLSALWQSVSILLHLCTARVPQVTP